VGVETPGLVYFHCGGFVLGSLDSYDNATRHLARATGAVLLSVENDLSSHARPGFLPDCEAIWEVRTVPRITSPSSAGSTSRPW